MKKKKIYNIIVLLLSVLILSGCGSKKDNNASNIIGLQVHKSELPSIETKKIEGLEDAEGYGHGIYTRQGECLHDMINYVKSTDDLSVYCHISNDLGDTYTFTVVALDNYHQIPFMVNGEECLNYTIEIPNSSETDIPIDLGEFVSGRHDLVFLTIINAGMKVSESDSITVTDGYMDGSMRSTFIVDDDTELNNPITYQTGTSDTIYSGISIEKKDDESYELSVSGVYDDDKYISVIVFDNYEEIENYTMELGAKKKATIPFDYSPDDSVNHELTAVVLYQTDGNNPEEPMEDHFSNRVQF